MKVRVPEVGESVFEAVIAKWHVQNGSRVAKDDLLCELETDKISLELHAETAGTIEILAEEGATANIGQEIANIGGEAAAKTVEPAMKPSPPPPQATAAEPAPTATLPAAAAQPTKPSPADTPAPVSKPLAATPTRKDDPRSRRVPLTPIRKKIAAHLLAARQQTAMLTTFNEVDMSRVKELRREHGVAFQKRFDVKLGMMSFFITAVTKALQAHPEVNARLDKDDIIYQDFYDIGVAIGAEKGLVVPVIRDAEQLGPAELEKGIKDFAERIAGNRISLADLEGGTFTISNGGVYGSMLSTPILNPPQTAVLGMHNIIERPVAEDGQVVIRPMMYLALSYDHRLIDGRQAVSFLKMIKESLETVEAGALGL